jgi:hypothetical protein
MPACSTNSAGASDAGPTCVPHDGKYTCLGGTWPVCSPDEIPGGACDQKVPSCMGCQESAGFTCVCSDAGPLFEGGPSPNWSCVGTEYTCQ